MMKKYRCFAAAALIVCMLCGCSPAAAGDESAGQTGSADAVETVKDIATTQYFTDEAVSESDIETILLAGINAPSAMNGQPWHFSVITDADVLNQIAEGMSFGGGGMTPPAGAQMPEGMTPPEGMEAPEGMNLPEGMAAPPAGDGTSAAAPAGNSGSTGGVSKAGLTDAPLAIVISCADGSELDAGLACQNMSVTAQLMGYGTKILSSPTMALNGANQAEYKELLGIPENQAAAAVLLIGKEDTSIDESVDGYTGATERNPMDETVTYVTGE